MRWHSLCSLILMLGLSGAPVAGAQSDGDPGLFMDDQTMRMELVIDLGKLCRDQDQLSCEDVDATLIVPDREGEQRSLSVRVRARGEWRMDPGHCDIPPLFLEFGDDTSNTAFAGQYLLPLTTHCLNNNRFYEFYVLREYLAYRIYNLLTGKSVRARLVHIAYRQASKKDKPRWHYAFLSEHFRSMARRNGAEIWQTDDFEFSTVDPMDSAVLDLFQFMIGHTDWSVPGQHNIILIHNRDSEAGSGVAAVPYDFDFSGLVSAAYAGPPPNLPINSTRERLYRGFCQPGIDWDALFSLFQEIRPEVFELVRQLPGLTRAARRRTRKFLEGFYDVLDSPGQREARIIKACREMTPVG